MKEAGVVVVMARNQITVRLDEICSRENPGWVQRHIAGIVGVPRLLAGSHDMTLLPL